MKIAIIGASGRVGAEFSRYAGRAEFILWSHEDLEVSNRHAVERRIAESDAEIVVNMAAYHNTDTAEGNPERTFAVNAAGALFVARACAAHGKKVVFASTDYVFGGDSLRRKPYLESDCADPVNVYGASKVAGETLVRATCPDHLIIRTSNLFGGIGAGKGWSFPEMVVQRAQARQTLRIVADQVMSPTYTPDLVDATMALLERGATGIVHLSNSGECSWYEFARKTLELMDIQHSIEACSAADFPAAARRPRYSALDSERLSEFGLPPMRAWDEALAAYVRQVQGATA